CIEKDFFASFFDCRKFFGGDSKFVCNFLVASVLDQHVIAVFPMTEIVYVENPTEEIIVDPEKFLQFIFGPDIECTLGEVSVLIDTVGVECAVKSTVRIGEFPCYEIQRFSDDSKIERIFR